MPETRMEKRYEVWHRDLHGTRATLLARGLTLAEAREIANVDRYTRFVEYAPDLRILTDEEVNRESDVSGER